MVVRSLPVVFATESLPSNAYATTPFTDSLGRLIDSTYEIFTEPSSCAPSHQTCPDNYLLPALPGSRTGGSDGNHLRPDPCSSLHIEVSRMYACSSIR